MLFAISLNVGSFRQRWPEEEVSMRYLAIKYNNNVEDIVPASLLDQMIVSGSIKQFFRPSEQRWIILGLDKTRGIGGSYEGVERRRYLPQVQTIRVETHASNATS
jgi:hypothetical protein